MPKSLNLKIKHNKKNLAHENPNPKLQNCAIWNPTVRPPSIVVLRQSTTQHHRTASSTTTKPPLENHMERRDDGQKPRIVSDAHPSC